MTRATVAALAGTTVEVVRAALESGDLRDLQPINVGRWARAQRAHAVLAGAR